MLRQGRLNSLSLAFCKEIPAEPLESVTQYEKDYIYETMTEPRFYDGFVRLMDNRTKNGFRARWGP